MNNILNRDFHETVGHIIKIEINDDLRLGNELVNRIPYNYIGEQEQLFKTQTDLNPLAMSEEELKNLIPKLNFNLPDTKLRLMEKKFIDNQDYWSLYELIKDMHPYNLTNNFAVYSYCRSLCRLPLMADEYKKINQDLKSLKKSMKKIKNKNMKKLHGKYEIKF